MLSKVLKLIHSRVRGENWRCDPWFVELAKCQEEIASSDPFPNYLNAYRSAEVSYWRHIARWLHEDSGTHQVARSLDIGCAYGTLSLFTKRLFNCKLYCIDFIPDYLSETVIRKHDINFKVNNIELDPFPWELKFDCIIFTEVLEHLNFHPLLTLQKIGQLLADNGKVYLSTPDAHEWGKVTKYYNSLNEMPQPSLGLPVVDDHVYQYNKDELFAIIHKAGFAVERFAYAPGSSARHFNVTLVRK